MTRRIPPQKTSYPGLWKDLALIYVAALSAAGLFAVGLLALEGKF